MLVPSTPVHHPKIGKGGGTEPHRVAWIAIRPKERCAPLSLCSLFFFPFLLIFFGNISVWQKKAVPAMYTTGLGQFFQASLSSVWFTRHNDQTGLCVYEIDDPALRLVAPLYAKKNLSWLFLLFFPFFFFFLFFQGRSIAGWKYTPAK